MIASRSIVSLGVHSELAGTLLSVAKGKS